jgi:hypothetical protein
MNQANAVVNALVAAQAAQASGPIIGGVVGGISGLIATVAAVGGTGVSLLYLLNQLNSTGGLTNANLVSLLVPGASVLQQLDPAVTAQLNSVNLAKLASAPALQASISALRSLPPPALPSPEQVLGALHSLPPPPPPPALPPPPVICGPSIGFFTPCI